MPLKYVVSRLWLMSLMALTIALHACGGDDRGHTQNDDGSVATGAPEGATGLDAGQRGTLDGAAAPAVLQNDDSGAVASDGADGGADTTTTSNAPDSGPKISLPALPSGVTLPTDGQRLSACYDDSGCTVDGLSCVHSLGLLGAGYCYDKCQANSDCQALDGVSSICSVEGQCVFDCTGTGLGNGTCPTNMVCRDIVPGLAVPIFRCEYPYGSGGKITPDYGQCDQAHGSNDCHGEDFCYVPISGIVTVPTGPGYCAPACSSASDCTVPAGATATASCSVLGRCEFDCTDMGTTCPLGMTCVDADDAPLITAMRCRYPTM